MPQILLQTTQGKRFKKRTYENVIQREFNRKPLTAAQYRQREPDEESGDVVKGGAITLK